MDANKFTKLMWSPEYVYGQGVLVGRQSDYTWQAVPGQGHNIYTTAEIIGTVHGMASGELTVIKSTDWNTPATG